MAQWLKFILSAASLCGANGPGSFLYCIDYHFVGNTGQKMYLWNIMVGQCFGLGE